VGGAATDRHDLARPPGEQHRDLPAGREPRISPRPGARGVVRHPGNPGGIVAVQPVGQVPEPSLREAMVGDLDDHSMSG
jgi:hypothetical protein